MSNDIITNTIHLGDCLDVMQTLPDNSVDAVITDPPYGLSFMSKKWDHGVPGVPFWEEALRVAKPGAYLLAFGGTRTFHRLTCAIEDAGWEIRDCLMWVYGTGFPKSLDVSKAIDKKKGVKRKVIGKKKGTSTFSDHKGSMMRVEITAPKSKEAKKYNGKGTNLKPAWEPIILARKKLEGTVIENLLKYETGCLNIDKCRIKSGLDYESKEMKKPKTIGFHSTSLGLPFKPAAGRFPANLIHDGSKEVKKCFPQSKATVTKEVKDRYKHKQYAGEGYYGNRGPHNYYEDEGSAERFFKSCSFSKKEKRLIYTAKVSQKEKGEDNLHPTVKPIKLMSYLIELVSDENSIILDPFAGSGSTGVACKKIGRQYILIEQEIDYVKIAQVRIKKQKKDQKSFFSMEDYKIG